jgi:hypothetical protein
MPSKLKRTALTLNPATDAILAKLSVLQRRPKARIIAELLDEIAPALARIAELLELASANRKSLPADAVHRIGALEELMSHTAGFAMDRLTAAVTPATAPAKQRDAARPPRRKRH